MGILEQKMDEMNIRILIVDDHQIFREGLRSMIEKKPGITVVGEAESGKTAIELARELLPDIVIMDIVMPDMNGIETTRHLAESLPQVKIIGLSMHDDVRFATEMLKAGASGFLLKDCAFEELVDAINTVKAEERLPEPEDKGRHDQGLYQSAVEGQSIRCFRPLRERAGGPQIYRRREIDERDSGPPRGEREDHRNTPPQYHGKT